MINAIFSFYSNLFDILLLRGNLSLTEPLREMAQLMADKFVVRVLKVLYKEVNNKFVNWNILCTTISLLLRILMKEETASILLVSTASHNPQEFSDLGKVLDLIINKGLALKSSNILIMAALLSVHLSIYESLHQHILNREFIAFLMGLLEPGDSEFIEKWNMDKQPTLDRVLAGESLLFLERLVGNPDSVIHLMSILLHNLCA